MDGSLLVVLDHKTIRVARVSTICRGMSQKNRPGLSVPQEPYGEVRIARLIEDLAELVSEIANIC